MKPASVLRPLVASALAITLSLAACDTKKQGSQEAARKEIIGKSSTLFTPEEAKQKLSALFPAIDAADSSLKKRGPVMQVAAAMRVAYSQGGYIPFWVSENGVTAFAKALLTDLDSLRNDGLAPERYGLPGLQKKFDALSKAGGSQDEAIAFDTACTRAYLQASRDLLMGAISTRQGDSLWFHTNDSLWNGPKLLAATSTGGKYTPLATFRSAVPTYGMLRNAHARFMALSANNELQSLKAQVQGKATVDSLARKIIMLEAPWVKITPGDSLSGQGQYIRGFQEYYGLAPTGRADSATVHLLARRPDSVLNLIAANLERLRWMPQSLEAQYVLVDIPLMELFFRRAGRDEFNMRVVVGKPARQTPALNADMANVVFSPGWGVPPTILKNDVLPGIAKRGGNYLAHKGLHAFNRHGKMVSASSVTAKNYRNFNFRQLPGARNALGEVKFNLPNAWDIYLHDTPHREDFVKRYRARSSGCIRVAKPKEFAEFILATLEGRDFTPSKIDSIIDTRKTRFENLKTRIPVHIIYLTAFEDNEAGRLRFLQDVYGRDARLIAALRRAAVL